MNRTRAFLVFVYADAEQMQSQEAQQMTSNINVSARKGGVVE
jgi:hypothetical protein